MSTRTLRVNELIQRELSDILRKHYQTEATPITITGVEVSPDLHEGRVFVGITGDEKTTEDRMGWLRKHAKEFRFELGRRIVLKHMPLFTYELDISTARGNRILAVLDQIAEADKAKASSQVDASPGNDASPKA